MNFYFPDSQDQIDPNFDFVSESHLVHRIRQRDDLYVHEALGTPPFDGILLSLSIVSGVAKNAKYSQASRNRLRREGIRNFFRIQNLTPRVATLGDCGAFGYSKLDNPPFTVRQVLDFNESCKIDTGLAPDHIPFGYFESDEVQKTVDLTELKRRLKISLTNAEKFVSIHNDEKYTFQPGAVAHGWTPKTYHDSFNTLQTMGYKFIAVGGLVPLKTRQIIKILERISSTKRQDVKLHLLGISRVDAMNDFENLGVTSLDSTSPFFQAFKDGTNNYHLGGTSYSAIRIPQVHGNTKLRLAITSGKIDQKSTETLEKVCLNELRKFDAEKSSIEAVLAAIRDYDEVTGVLGNKYERIRKLLEETPWKFCMCAICRRLSVEVVIFRGSERNKSRGFHNLFNLRKDMISKKLISPNWQDQDTSK